MWRKIFVDISSIKKIIEIPNDNISHRFQPLWKLDNWNVFGYEAFLRHENESNPEEFFRVVREKNMLYRFDSLSIIKAIQTINVMKGHLLFVNVFPSTVLNDEFPSFLESIIQSYPLVLGQLVFELSETKDEEELWNLSNLTERLQWIRDKGIFIALDDLGKGAASLQKLIEYKPNFIKLDRYFSEGLHQSKEKQEMLSLLVDYSKFFNIKVILEGIETSKDLAFAKFLNVDI